MRTCCYDCPDRTIECHAECEIYKEFARKKKAANKKERLERASGSVRNNELRYDIWAKKGGNSRVVTRKQGSE